jgi:hypothetical protein
MNLNQIIFNNNYYYNIKKPNIINHKSQKNIKIINNKGEKEKENLVLRLDTEKSYDNDSKKSNIKEKQIKQKQICQNSTQTQTQTKTISK